LLLGYYDPDGRLIYAGRVGTGINDAELERLWRQLQRSPRTRCRSMCRRRRARPLRVAAGAEPRPLGAAGAGRRGQVSDWTDDNLLRQVVYEGLREDKPAKEVRREVPYPKIDTVGAGAANKPNPFGTPLAIASKTKTPPKSGGVLSTVFGC
jgi:bifunctional non-homologous end joining protein LigD